MCLRLLLQEIAPNMLFLCSVPTCLPLTNHVQVHYSRHKASPVRAAENCLQPCDVSEAFCNIILNTTVRVMEALELFEAEGPTQMMSAGCHNLQMTNSGHQWRPFHSWARALSGFEQSMSGSQLALQLLLARLPEQRLGSVRLETQKMHQRMSRHIGWENTAHGTKGSAATCQHAI